jgi:indolepyruvate decarboxylase
LSTAEERPGRVTGENGVGAVSAINDVGGSYRDHVPVICIAGSIPLRSIDRGLGMHHTMADGTSDHFLDASALVTAAHTRLTPRNAAIEIDRLILTSSVQAPNDTMIFVESIMDSTH